jgi:hypothetical protein
MPTGNRTAPGLIRGLGLWSAIAVIVGSMIGQAVFLVASDMARELGSPTRVIAVWIIGGIVVQLQTSAPQQHVPPGGVFFLTERVSVATASGVIGFAPGTSVRLVSRGTRNKFRVTDGRMTFDVSKDKLTDNADLGALLAQNDAASQQALADHMRAVRETNGQRVPAENARMKQERQAREEMPRKLHETASTQPANTLIDLLDPLPLQVDEGGDVSKPDLAAPAPKPVPRWDSIAAHPLFQAMPAEQKQAVVDQYARDAHAYGLTQPGADPAALREHFSKWREQRLAEIYPRPKNLAERIWAVLQDMIRQYFKAILYYCAGAALLVILLVIGKKVSWQRFTHTHVWQWLTKRRSYQQKQTLAVWIALTLLIASWIYPPWIVHTARKRLFGVPSDASYHRVWHFLLDSGSGSPADFRIDWLRLFVLDLIIVAAAGGVLFTIRQNHNDRANAVGQKVESERA